jgi:hypothetical protein
VLCNPEIQGGACAAPEARGPAFISTPPGSNSPAAAGFRLSFGLVHTQRTDHRPCSWHAPVLLDWTGACLEPHIPLAFHLPIHSSNPHQRIPPNNAGRLRFLFAIFARVCHGRRGLHYDFALDIRIYFIGLERRQITSRKASIHHAQAAAHFVVVVSYPGIRQGNARSANTHFPIASQPAAHAIPAAQPSACPKIQP